MYLSSGRCLIAVKKMEKHKFILLRTALYSLNDIKVHFDLTGAKN